MMVGIYDANTFGPVHHGAGSSVPHQMLSYSLCSHLSQHRCELNACALTTCNALLRCVQAMHVILVTASVATCISTHVLTTCIALLWCVAGYARILVTASVATWVRMCACATSMHACALTACIALLCCITGYARILVTASVAAWVSMICTDSLHGAALLCCRLCAYPGDGVSCNLHQHTYTDNLRCTALLCRRLCAYSGDGLCCHLGQHSGRPAIRRIKGGSLPTNHNSHSSCLERHYRHVHLLKQLSTVHQPIIT
jgi:hypothetical protein